MPDAFAQMVDLAIRFFDELEASNTHDWVAPRKTFYTNAIQRPAQLLTVVLGDEITRLTGEQMQGEVFELGRGLCHAARDGDNDGNADNDGDNDGDERPYNTYLRLLWRPPRPAAPVWLFNAAPHAVTVGVGLLEMTGAPLARYRTMVEHQGDRLEDALMAVQSAAGAELTDWGAQARKRVPAPFPTDHPKVGLMHRTSLTVSAPLPDAWRKTGLVPSVIERVQRMMPLWDVLDNAFG